MRLLYFVRACTAIAARLASAQTPGTGMVGGTVRSAAGEALSGVAVTATSPALLGERAATTDENGVYLLRGLPPGGYRIKFAATGLTTTGRAVTVNAATTVRLDLTLDVAPVAESVVVSAAAPGIPGTSGASATAGKALVDQLPMSRRPIDIAELSPGLTTNTFQGGGRRTIRVTKCRHGLGMSQQVEGTPRGFAARGGTAFGTDGSANVGGIDIQLLHTAILTSVTTPASGSRPSTCLRRCPCVAWTTTWVRSLG